LPDCKRKRWVCDGQGSDRDEYRQGDRDLATLRVGDDGNSDHAVVEAILSAVRGFDRMSVDGTERARNSSRNGVRATKPARWRLFIGGEADRRLKGLEGVP
jgi:hypothetical protein